MSVLTYCPMDKQEAITLIGGSRKEAARLCGITPSAISQWPKVLDYPQLTIVQAALYRKKHKLPPPPVGHARKSKVEPT